MKGKSMPKVKMPMKMMPSKALTSMMKGMKGMKMGKKMK